MISVSSTSPNLVHCYELLKLTCKLIKLIPGLVLFQDTGLHFDPVIWTVMATQEEK